MTHEDTIAAVATAAGPGGIGIVRVSGPDVEAIANEVLGFLPAPRRATLAEFKNTDGETIDSGLALYFPAPHSFTGEAVLELHGHGGHVAPRMVLSAVVAAGARFATAGEFSRRAFENDKLDLAQAEAVAALVAAGSERAARAALRSLAGEFSVAVHGLVEALTGIRVYVEAAIDFPDEEIDFLADDALTARLDSARLEFDSLLARAATGRRLNDGLSVVLAGRPNAGKSSLMNRLSGEDTAIVTETAGTTRDVLRVTIQIDGVAFEVADTAGLRDNPERIEQEGIRRAQAAMASADAVVWLVDETLPVMPEPTGSTPVLVVHNKIDLTGRRAGLNADGSLSVSARTGEGIDALRRRLVELSGAGAPDGGAFSARQRHIDAIERARAHFDQGAAALQAAAAGELLAEELRLAQDALGEITGTLHSDDLLGRIFSDFCIGK